MTTEKQQRDFLKQCTTDGLPVIFTDSSGTFTTFLSRLRFSAPDKREDRAEEMAELVLAEASGGAWDSEQAAFLRACGDDIEPLLYTQSDGKQRPVILTRISWATPYKGPAGDEPVVQLRLVESFAGHWLVYAEKAAVADSASIVLSDALSPNVYGSGKFGYGVYG